MSLLDIVIAHAQAKFRTVTDFEKYCYYECPIGKTVKHANIDNVKRLGCRTTCKLVEELQKFHPEWFGDAKK